MKTTKQRKLIKKMFKMIYSWGRANIVVDENSQTFKDILAKIFKEKNTDICTCNYNELIKIIPSAIHNRNCPLSKK